MRTGAIPGSARSAESRHLLRAKVVRECGGTVSDNAAVSEPPNGQPRYRLLTGPDDENFCRRVSEAIAQGYELHGSPAATFNGSNVIVAQAVVWPTVR